LIRQLHTDQLAPQESGEVSAAAIQSARHGRSDPRRLHPCAERPGRRINRVEEGDFAIRKSRFFTIGDFFSQ
jgi:hypothetical protein